MKNLIYIAILSGQLCSAQNWFPHSAVPLPEKRWDVGIFQPFRFGVSEKLEYSLHPLLFFVMPNLSIKLSHKDVGSWSTASRHGFFYPTPLLNMLTHEDKFGMISPEFDPIPRLLGLYSDWLMTGSLSPSTYLTIKTGLSAGISFGDLDERSSIDLPLVYHRLGVFYNKWALRLGVDLTGQIAKKLRFLVDGDAHVLPGFDGDLSLEHKGVLIWDKSEHFRLICGYKFVWGRFPFGTQARILPYIPMIETWVPFIDLQWTGTRI
ncbi:MAG TPA: hypothetical protein EYO07_03035 [Candidatus Marinimicrobia bacterium]|nr:hypothetical protein [Candidatus Neomarinimicrobiota bacterium]